MFGKKLLAILLMLVVSTAHASTEVAWGDLLDPDTLDFHDPFTELSYDQIDNLRTIVKVQERLSADNLNDSEKADAKSRIEMAQELLMDQGIDADWLIAQRWLVAERRERAATAVNPSLAGKSIALGGFAIPAPPDADGTQIVYLVPERGMCSHTPPPNPNQMIRARLKGDWSPRMMHEPVRLTGRLIAEETRHSFRIVDGEVPMRASFVMEVSKVETIADMQTDAAAVNEWAAGIAERLRASGQLPQENADATQ